LTIRMNANPLMGILLFKGLLASGIFNHRG